MNGEPSSTELDPRLIVLSHQPLNAEAPLAAQLGVITPNHLFYHRNRFATARLDPDRWRLSVGGLVEKSFELTYAQLRALPSRTMLVTLECAGNGRSNFHPPAEGEPWQYGAVSTAEWTGVSLGTVLAAAGVRPQAREILVQGVDGGKVDNSGREVPFARSMPTEAALDPDVLLAYGMNGEPLPAEHGFPVRLVVPGWYGMASVKWVAKIEAIAEPFVGFFQTERYIMPDPVRGEAAPIPLTVTRVRSLIVEPAPGVTLPRGDHRIRGLAWSGSAAVERVDVSVDGGRTWQAAELTSPAERYAWRRWEIPWRAETSGPATLRSRAFDQAGNAQPDEPDWNRLGYANNAIQAIDVTVA